jgi:hypothetical protein
MSIRGRFLTLVFASTLSLSYVASAEPTPDAITVTLDAGASSPPIDASVPVDTGSGSAIAPAVDATPAPGVGSGSGSDGLRADPADKESLLKAAYKAITEKDWFLLAGVALAAVGMLANWLLSKKWSVFKNDKVRWVTVGVLAGLGGIMNAWLADEPAASSQTLLGALKVFAVAVFAYVSAKKLSAPPASSTVT